MPTVSVPLAAYAYTTSQDASYSVARSGSALAYQNNYNGIWTGQQNTGSSYVLSQAFLSFNAGSYIPSNATLTGATLRGHVNTVGTDTSDYIEAAFVGPSLPISSPVWTAAPGPGNLYITQGSAVVGSDVVFSFENNPTLLSSINRSGATRVTLYSRDQANNSAPAGAAIVQFSTFYLDVTYTVPPAPTVTAVSPASAPVSGGTTMTLTGTGFTANSAGTNTVQFVDVNGTVRNATGVVVGSDTSITCTLPGGATAGVGSVRVTNANGTGSHSFTYTDTQAKSSSDAVAIGTAGASSLAATSTTGLSKTDAATPLLVDSSALATTQIPSPVVGPVGAVIVHAADVIQEVGGQTLRLKQADLDVAFDTAIDGITPPLPGGPPSYSYVKNFQVYADQPAVRYITNVGVYFGERPVSWGGVEVYIRTSNTFVDPTVQKDTPLPGFNDNAGAYTEDNPLSVNGELTAGLTGYVGDFIQVQCRINDQADPGILDSFPLTITWQEWS